jgi:hypothetical protein
VPKEIFPLSNMVAQNGKEKITEMLKAGPDGFGRG